MWEHIVDGKLDILLVDVHSVHQHVLAGALHEDSEDVNLVMSDDDVLTQPFPLLLHWHPHLVTRGSFLIAFHGSSGVLDIGLATFGILSSVGSSRCLFTTLHYKNKRILNLITLSL